MNFTLKFVNALLFFENAIFNNSKTLKKPQKLNSVYYKKQKTDKHKFIDLQSKI